MRYVTIGTILTFILACGGGESPGDPSPEAGSSTSCKKTCDPMTGSGPYMDEAYRESYSPCLSDAASKGMTADDNRCEEKATAYCIKACEAG